MLGMSMSMTQSYHQEQRQSLTLSQRLAISAQQVGLRIELVAALHGERYEPEAKCPRCNRELAANEILAGFLDNVNDFTTQCTGCHHRFEPKLICFGETTRIEIPFYCDIQAQHRLRGLSHLPPSEIAREYPGEYRSAVVHHGTLAAMFESINIKYNHDELEGWQAKAQPFLGRLPDTVIAQCVRVNVQVIRKLRRTHGIDRYTKHVALEEVEDW